jgi:hypothetical protein
VSTNRNRMIKDNSRNRAEPHHFQHPH